MRPEWWERLGGFLLQFRAFRILMRVRMVLTWVSLLIVAVCFWLARGKTVSWGMTSGFFALSMPWAGAVGWLSFQVAAAARVPVSQTASQVVIADVVEAAAAARAKAHRLRLALTQAATTRRPLPCWWSWVVRGRASCCGHGCLAPVRR